MHQIDAIKNPEEPKIGFADEIGTLARAMNADGQNIMEIVCRDKQLNISTAYLRPGFAYGGSCLPRDLRALVRSAQREAIDTEVLSAILASNDSHIQRGLDDICGLNEKRISLIGLGFKAGTDDLRESPLVVVAETLLGRGFDLRIYDPYVAVSGLVGQNLTFVETHLPHLASLMTDDAREAMEHADVLVLGTDVANEVDHETNYAGHVVDLRRDLVVRSKSKRVAYS